MREVEIRFERENREGIVAAGTYLIDVCKRFGIRFEDACSIESDTHFCSVKVSKGTSLLSPETTVESEHFAKHGRSQNERLACQVKIDAPGEVVIMTGEKVKEPTVEAPTEDMNEQYRKEFAELPLEKKIANLVQLETIALGETVSFIINSPFKIADKLMDVMAEFGFKKEEQQKEAARPAEHKAKEAKTDGTGRKTKKKHPPKPHTGQ